jgi:hypothetical protein
MKIVLKRLTALTKLKFRGGLNYGYNGICDAIFTGESPLTDISLGVTVSFADLQYLVAIVADRLEHGTHFGTITRLHIDFTYGTCIDAGNACVSLIRTIKTMPNIIYCSLIFSGVWLNEAIIPMVGQLIGVHRTCGRHLAIELDVLSSLHYSTCNKLIDVISLVNTDYLTLILK